MSDKFFVIRSFALFFNHNPLRLILLFLLIILLSLTQGISIVMLVPLLQMVAGTKNIPNIPGVDWIFSILHSFSITITSYTVLICFGTLLIVLAILTQVQSIWQSDYQQSFAHSIRTRLFHKILYADWLVLNKNSKHNHIQVLTTEIPKMGNYYFFYLSLSAKILFILAHLVIAALISPKFTLIITVFGGMSFIFINSFLKKANKLGYLDIALFKDILKRIDDFWLSIKLAKVQGSENFYQQKFDEANEALLINQHAMLRNRASSAFFFSLLGTLGTVALLVLAIEMHLELTSLFTLVLLFSRIFPRFTAINSDLTTMLSSVGAVQLVLELDKSLKDPVLSLPTKRSEVTGFLITKAITLKDVHFGYSAERKLFDGFNASIPANQITGILGLSGKGKTTLLDLIAGLHKPHQGDILIDDKSIFSEDRVSWREQLSYLPQDPVFIDGTIRENVVWDNPHPVTDDEIQDALIAVNLADIIQKQPKGLDSIIANFGFYFSGGERQRLALVRAILRKPSLLLLDEATSALDQVNEDAIMKSLKRIKAHTTIVFITHRTRLKEQFDKVIEL